jgi:hypothetical protein
MVQLSQKGLNQTGWGWPFGRRGRSNRNDLPALLIDQFFADRRPNWRFNHATADLIMMAIPIDVGHG